MTVIFKLKYNIREGCYTESPTPPKGVGKNKVSSMIELSKVRAASSANSEQKSRNDSFCSSEKRLFLFHKDEKSKKNGEHLDTNELG